MILTSISATLLICIIILVPADCKSNSNAKERVLDGQLTEATSLPLELSCPKSYGFILIGGVTFNGTDAPSGMEDLGRTECEEQLADPKQKTKGMTSCLITFGGNSSIEQTGVIRVVYKCLTTKGSRKPGDEWIRTSDKALRTAISAGKLITYTCDGSKEIIEIQTLSKDGEPGTAEEIAAYHQKVLPECYKQTVQKLQSGKQGNIICQVSTDPKDGLLKVEYYCATAVKGATSPIFVTV